MSAKHKAYLTTAAIVLVTIWLARRITPVDRFLGMGATQERVPYLFGGTTVAV